MARTNHALIPNRARRAMLVVDGRLPVALTESDKQSEALARFADLLGWRPVFLRVVARDLHDNEYVYEFDAPAEGWQALPPVTWVALGDVDPEALLSAPLAHGIEQWIEEQRGVSISPLRPDWARPGWLAEATDWVAETVGETVESQIVRQWPLSAVHRFGTTAGPLYLKAVFGLFRHEPAVTEALAREHPGRVPDVVAVEPERGWMLMREFSSEFAADAGPERWADGCRVAASIQRAWVGRESELTALGAPQRGLATLRGADAPPNMDELIERLSAFELPETIVHGDLHQWNAVVEPDGLRVVDWSDAAIGHPFVDLATALFHWEEEHRDLIVDTYLEPWRDFAPLDRLRGAATLGEVLGCVYQSESYKAIAEAFEPLDRPIWRFAGAGDEYLQRAVELADRL